MTKSRPSYMIHYRLRDTDDFWQPAVPTPVSGKQLTRTLRRVKRKYGKACEFQTTTLTDACPTVTSAGFCGQPR